MHGHTPKLYMACSQELGDVGRKPAITASSSICSHMAINTYTNIDPKEVVAATAPKGSTISVIAVHHILDQAYLHGL